MTTARYTSRDPHFAILCGGCRWMYDHRCMGTFRITAGVHCGTYTCTCIRCGGQPHKEVQ